jgi:hypothetical protein
MKAHYTALRDPSRWTVVIGARFQRFATEAEARKALENAPGGYVVPPEKVEEVSFASTTVAVQRHATVERVVVDDGH